MYLHILESGHIILFTDQMRNIRMHFQLNYNKCTWTELVGGLNEKGLAFWGP